MGNTSTPTSTTPTSTTLGIVQDWAPPIFTCKKFFTAQYLPISQCLLKNQFMYRSKVSTLCVRNC